MSNSTQIHFINVGQGNMTLIICDNGAVICYDCNITNDNEKAVFAYLAKVMPTNKSNIDVFVASHRDKDHINGVEKLHKKYKISQIWDSGQYKSDQADNKDYQDYMKVKKEVNKEIVPDIGQNWNAGLTNIICLNTFRKDEKDPNAQSIVLKISHSDKGSVLLTGDTDAYVWKEYIMKENKDKLKSNILLGSHHGSSTFFYIGNEEYTDHIASISPSMTIISVGDNVHGHPDIKAINRYEKYSSGSRQGNKIYRTDKQGNIKLELSDTWSLSGNQ